MNKQITLQLITLSLLFLQGINLNANSGFERYQDFTENFKAQGEQSAQRLATLAHAKKTRQLQEQIENLYYEKESAEKGACVQKTQNPYMRFLPKNSYAKLNVSRYATDDQIQAAYEKLKAEKNGAVLNLSFEEALRTIKNHRKLEASYLGLIKELDIKDGKNFRIWQTSKKGFIKNNKNNSTKLVAVKELVDTYTDQVRKENNLNNQRSSEKDFETLVFIVKLFKGILY